MEKLIDLGMLQAMQSIIAQTLSSYAELWQPKALASHPFLKLISCSFGSIERQPRHLKKNK